MEEQAVTSTHLDGCPCEILNHPRIDAPSVILREDVTMEAIDHFETAIGNGCVIDCHHHAEYLVNKRVGGLVLMGGESCTSGKFVVDLLFVEQRWLAEQLARHLNEGTLAQD